MPVGILPVKRKIKDKKQGCGLDEHPSDSPHWLTTGQVRLHGRPDQAGQSFFRNSLFTQFFNMPSAR